MVLFMIIASLWSLLLRRYTQQDDLIWGTIFSLRNSPELASIIGDFINPVPLRIQLRGEQTLDDCIQQVKALLIEVQPHIHLPFDRLVADIASKRSASNSPLFNTMLIFQPPLDMAGNWQLSRTDMHTDTAKFDLLIEFQERTDGAVIKLEYNHCFSDHTAARLLTHFSYLLEQAPSHLNNPVDSINILTNQEYQQLSQWNSTAVNFPAAQSLLGGWSEQVRQNADTIALVFGQQTLTYAELEYQSNQLACYLQQRGVQTGDCVGLCMQRSLKQIIALLGILKVGAAYVPLDPSYPKDRLSIIIEEAELKWIATDNVSRLQIVHKDIELINIEQDWSDILQLTAYTYALTRHEEAWVYIIYTSGSTGKPKGVIHTYRSLNNLIAWQLTQNQTGMKYKTLQFASINFDVSFQEIFSTLCGGGTLILLSEEDKKSTKQILALIEQHQVQRFYLPYVVLRQLADYLLESNITHWPESLCDIITAGEQLQITPAISALFQRLPNCRLHNHYGPSETHVVTAFQLPEDVALWELLPPIGQPISNVQIYILNTQLQPVPVGIVGELYIGGLAVAKGYFGNSELTQERFILNPFAQEKEMLYKTGDLARFRKDGLIDYLGRIDNQIKIRGFRIEPAEIETLLGQHSDIKQAVVLSKTSPSEEKYLVAFLLLHENSDRIVTDEQLQIYLQAKLPDYMIPQQFIKLDQFPLSPSGKVDRLKLTDRVIDAPAKTQKYYAPRDTLEMELVNIWQETLSIEKIGIRDNFFRLGGHSLLAMKLMAKIERVFNQDIPINALIQSPTIEALAQYLRSTENQDAWQVIVPMHTRGDAKPLFCIPGSGGNIIYFQELVALLNPQQPVYGLQARGLDGVALPHDTIEAMANDYITQIRTIQPYGPYYLLGHSVGGAVAFAMANILRHQSETIAFLGLLDTPAPKVKQHHLEQAIHWDNAQWLIAIAQLLEHLTGYPIPTDINVLQALPENEQIKLFQHILQEVGVIPVESKIQRVQGMVNVLRACDTAYMHYQPQRIPAQQINLFRAKQLYTEDQLGLLYECPDDLSWGWQDYTDIPINVEWVEGNHLSMLKQPQVQSLAACLTKHLDNIRQGQKTKSSTPLESAIA